MPPFDATSFGLGLALASLIAIFHALYLRFRRQRTFARVQRQYTERPQGLYLERPIGNAFDAGTKSQGKGAEHVCSFTPCPHLQREAVRQATELRVMKGGQS